MSVRTRYAIMCVAGSFALAGASLALDVFVWWRFGLLAAVCTFAACLCSVRGAKLLREAAGELWVDGDPRQGAREGVEVS